MTVAHAAALVGGDDRKKICLAAGLGILLTVVVSICSYSDHVQAGISESVVRLHIVANSDSPGDQALKLKARDGVLSAFGDDIALLGGAEEAELYIFGRLGEIRGEVVRVLRENGCLHSVRAELGRESFPTRIYGEAALPAGEYTALRIIIGDGGGQNWWCVMFPPLCDVSFGGPKLRDGMTDEGYELVMSRRKPGPSVVKVKFKAAEIWQEVKKVFATPRIKTP
jgi:stage II sporulation protein R